MSMSPNDPFANPNQPAASYGDATGNSPPKKSKKGLYIGLGCAGIVLLSILVCCGSAAMMTQFGIGIVADEYASQLEGNPVIVEHIGEIDELSVDWGSTFTRAAEGDGQSEAIGFSIRGSKGSGVVYIEQDNSSGDDVRMKSATLVTSDGNSFPIDVNAIDEGGIGELNEMFDVGEEVAP